MVGEQLELSALGARRRTVALTTALAGATAALVTVGLRVVREPGATLRFPFWAVAAGFAVVDLMVVHIQVRREGHAFTLDELPLVLGMFLASPLSLLGGRLLGEGATLLVRERQAPLKLAFNLSLFAGETAVALMVFHATRGDAPLESARSWLAALVAVGAADLLGGFAVATVIRWHGGAPDPREVVVLGVATALANTSLGLAAVLLISVNPAALALLGVIAVVLFVAYRGYTALIERHRSLELLYEFMSVIGTSTDATDVVESVLERTRELMRVDVAMMTVVDTSTGRPSFRIRCDQHGTVRVPVTDDPGDEAWVIDALAASTTLVRIPRAPKDELRASYLARLGAKDLMAAPLQGKEGLIGTLAVLERLGDLETFGAADARLFDTLAHHAAVVLENGRLIDALRREVRDRRHEALHDHLTGLPNRTYFLERLNRVVADGDDVAVMLVDLDHFKEVNDTLGHQSGDQLLTCVADRLRAVMPERAMVARLGGDEFAVLAEGLHEAAALRFARLLRATLAEPFTVEEVSVDSGGSIGVALWPQHANDIPSLLKRADIAMYAAKTTDMGVQLYEHEVDQHSVRRLTLSAALRQALAQDDLIVHYQPKARMSDGAIIGAEALIRWNHPEHGPVSPDEFVPIAERASLIGLLTRFVLRSALEQRNHWARHGHDLSISVNLSARSLFDIGFAAELLDILRDTGTRGDKLTFEITETSIMDRTRSDTFLRRIAATDVRLSVDDFGTGFSSLSYLHHLPVHEVKIDKSFVAEMASGATDGSIVRSIIDLGHNLGLNVVAEGVEDEAAWSRLDALGCDIAQGYHLARPLPTEDFLAWVDARSRGTAEHASRLYVVSR